MCLLLCGHKKTARVGRLGWSAVRSALVEVVHYELSHCGADLMDRRILSRQNTELAREASQCLRQSIRPRRVPFFLEAAAILVVEQQEAAAPRLGHAHRVEVEVIDRQ